MSSYSCQPTRTPTDAVDVVVHVTHVVDDHVSDIRNVDATAHDVCGNQQPRLSTPEVVQGFQPHVLRPPPVHGVRLEALLGELVPQLVSHDFVVDKHEDFVALVPQHTAQVGVEALLLGPVTLLPRVLVEDDDLLLDVGASAGHALFVLPYEDPHRLLPILAERVCQVLHFLRPSRREEEHVPLRSDGCCNLADIVLEAAVQHPISLIQHEVRHTAE
mmetsp:Transcript_39503/g.123222  ORF Transcript_39503/g.123222 Transcript_39503/m.123222 type:complete len:217 (+) Transcript_39503:513-1163(+)